MPHLPLRRLQNGSLSSSKIYLLPMRRTCFCGTRYGGVGQGPGETGVGGRGPGHRQGAGSWGRGPGQGLGPRGRGQRQGARATGRGQGHRGTGSRAGARPELPSMVLASQVDELERKVRSQQEQLFLARQELTNTVAELKARAIQAEGGHMQAHSGGAQRGEDGWRGHPGSPTHAVSPGLPERLELEKKRSRQSSEDLEQLRAKEVPPAVPCDCLGPTGTSGAWCPQSTPLLCSLAALGCCVVDLGQPQQVTDPETPDQPLERTIAQAARCSVPSGRGPGTCPPSLLLAKPGGQPLLRRKCHHDLPATGWRLHGGCKLGR